MLSPNPVALYILPQAIGGGETVFPPHMIDRQESVERLMPASPPAVVARTS